MVEVEVEASKNRPHCLQTKSRPICVLGLAKVRIELQGHAQTGLLLMGAPLHLVLPGRTSNIHLL